MADQLRQNLSAYTPYLFGPTRHPHGFNDGEASGFPPSDPAHKTAESRRPGPGGSDVAVVMSESGSSGTAGSSFNRPGSSDSPETRQTSASTTSGQQPQASGVAGSPQLHSDKSCKSIIYCRDRRVRCDRSWPACERCTKRKETCSYPNNANIEDKADDNANPRVKELEHKLANVTKQLKATQSSNRSQATAAPQPPVPPLGAIPLAHHPPAGSAFAAPLAASSDNNLPDKIQSAFAASVPNPIERRIRNDFLLQQQSVSHFNIDQRLAETKLAEALTLSLLDASAVCCCSRMPALQILVDRIPFYKNSLYSLDAAGQLCVAVLCALGARAVPHSAILGVPSHALSDGSATPQLYLRAGERREKACRTLETRAHELAWQGGVLSNDSWDNVKSLAGLTQLLIFEEARAKPSRFFLRNALGMYRDLVHDIEKQAENPGGALRKNVARSLLADDTTIAPRFNMPCLVSMEDLQTFYTREGVELPNTDTRRIGTDLQRILQSTFVTHDTLTDALLTTGLWVCVVQRKFAFLSTAKQPGQPSVLPQVHDLYALIDEVHSAIQQLQQFLVNISYVPQGCENDPYALDHFVLLGVRADTYLVDIVNLMHVWLHRQRDHNRGIDDWDAVEGDERLERLRWESTLRVRKCLKLIAFYSQLYLSSSDKHVVHHLVIQLELLPGWTQLVCQRIGTPDGPISEEFEATDEELEWLRQGLELACYFTPVAGQRLQELCSERAKMEQLRQRRQSGSVHSSMQRHPSAESRHPNFLVQQHISYDSGFGSGGSGSLVDATPQSGNSSNDGGAGSGGGSSSTTQNPFGDMNASDTSPFVFNQLGIVTSTSQMGQQPQPLVDMQSADLTDQDRVGLTVPQGSSGSGSTGGAPGAGSLTNHFHGGSWMMDVTLGNLWESGAGGVGPADGQTGSEAIGDAGGVGGDERGSREDSWLN